MNWLVRPSATGYFKREWVTPVRLFDQQIVAYCRAWDIAGTLPSDENPNPDWTAGVLLAKTKQGRYIIVDVVRFRARIGEVIKRIIQTAKNDPPETKLILPQDAGAAGIAAAQDMIKQLLAEGIPARSRPTNKSKVIRFQPFAAAAEAKLVDYVEDVWNNDYFAEAEAFDGSRNKKDDMCDATSDAFITLAQQIQIPNFMHGLSQVTFGQLPTSLPTL